MTGDDMTVEERLLEWAREKFYPGWEEPSPSAVLANLMDTGRDERLKKRRGRNASLALARRIRKKRGAASQEVPSKETRGVRMEIVVLDGTSTACPPDGGAGRMIERMAKSIERSRRCRELGEILDLMPRHLFLIVDVTYGRCVAPREIPRSDGGAAKMLGITVKEYRSKVREMVAWLGARMPETARAA